jgi:hypothetical protein
MFRPIAHGPGTILAKPCPLFRQIREAFVLVCEPQHLLPGQLISHLVPECADFPGLLTPITLVVIGLHGAERYSRRPAVTVTAITETAGFVDAAGLNFAGVIPYTPL